mgnify:CR=1 FL=1
MNEIYVLIALSFLIFASPFLASLARIPLSPMEIMLGIIAANLGLLPPSATFDLAAQIGFCYLMFLAGCEVDFRALLAMPRKILRLILIFLALLYILSALAIWVFELPQMLIIAAPLMSVGLLSALYKEYGKDQAWLNLAMPAGVIGELISIAALTVGGIYLKNGFGVEMALHIGALLGFSVAALAVFKGLEILFWWFPALKTVIMPKYDKNEKDVRFAMALFCLICAGVMLLGLEVVIGAFIAGTFLPTFFSHKDDLIEKLSSFGFGFLVPIFFIHIGSTFKLSSLGSSEVIKDAVFIFLAMLGTRVVSSLLFLGKLGFRGIFLFAISQSMPLTLLIAVATIAHKSGEISDYSYSSFILASLAQAIIGAIIIKILMQSKSKE